MAKDRKLGMRYWGKVLLLLLAALSITWYAKQPKIRKPLRTHGTAAWIVPTSQGLSTLIVLGDDGIDSNASLTGMRFWFHPPARPKEFEVRTPAFYRGPSLAVFGKNISAQTYQDLADMIDTGGILFSHAEFADTTPWLKNIRHRSIQFQDSHPEGIRWRAGSDIQLEFSSQSTGISWNGYRIRWWETMNAVLQDSVSQSISLGIISQCLQPGMEPPLARESLVKTLVYCGGKVLPDSSRISLGDPNTGFTLIEDQKAGQLLAKRVHFLETTF